MAILDAYRGFVVALHAALDDDGGVPRETVAFLRRARRTKRPVMFITDDTMRTAGQIAALFDATKAKVEPDGVVTSSAAAAVLLGEQAPRTLAIGSPALVVTLQEHGIPLVHDAAEAEAVVVGWDADMSLPQLQRATEAIIGGARFVGTSRDRIIRTGGRSWPGPGAILAMLQSATGVAPEVAGKPQTTMLELAAARLGVDGPILVVGSRVDTDLAAATKLGWDGALLASTAKAVTALVDADQPPRWVLPHLGSLVGDEPPTVRRAREQDLSAIIALLKDVGFDHEAAASRLRNTLVAVEPGGQVVGTIAWETADTAAHLRGITVAPQERGHGTASHLVARALHALRDGDAEYAYLLTPGAESLFEKLGFWRVHRDRVPPRILETALYGEPSKGATALVRRLK